MFSYIFPIQKQLQTHQKAEKIEEKRNIKTNQYIYTIGINQLDILIIIY